MSTTQRAPRRSIRWRLGQLMRKAGWAFSPHDKRITGRLYHLTVHSWHWWDWGHPLMILIGSPSGGNYDEPEPPTWWYRFGTPKRMWRTRYPIHPLSTIEVVKSYDEFRALTAGANEDQLEQWKAICVDQDGALRLGWQYWGKGFYGLNRWEVALLRRYLFRWRLRSWFGLRSWLYSQALHAAVHQRKPGSCQATPPRTAGGYSHWHCQRPRHHTGLHRYNNMVWGAGVDRVQHVPEPYRPPQPPKSIGEKIRAAHAEHLARYNR